MSYLICEQCWGYYKIQEGESVEDFISCECGGNLILVENIHDYIEQLSNNHKKTEIASRGKFNKKNHINLFLVVLFTTIFILFLNSVEIPLQISNYGLYPDNSLLASDSKGYVTKEVYSGYNASETGTKVIAIVTGIHPREKISRTVVSNLIKQYPLLAGQKIVHYDITVKDRPNDYKIGRMNGEDLAADYIYPDVLISHYDLIIICHDHAPGYGKGFYVATPKMDEQSVKLAEAVNKTLPQFNYYKTTKNTIRSTSAAKFSKPLASAGFKAIVYEIPGLSEYNNAYNMTYRLIETCFRLI